MNQQELGELSAIKIFCENLGYGRVMQMVEDLWHKKEIDAGRGHNSGALTVGPCRAYMVPCPHPIKDYNGHCDICCGAGRITKGTRDLIKKAAL